MRGKTLIIVSGLECAEKKKLHRILCITRFNVKYRRYFMGDAIVPLLKKKKTIKLLVFYSVIFTANLLLTLKPVRRSAAATGAINLRGGGTL